VSIQNSEYIIPGSNTSRFEGQLDVMALEAHPDDLSPMKSIEELQAERSVYEALGATTINQEAYAAPLVTPRNKVESIYEMTEDQIGQTIELWRESFWSLGDE
jgi:hypothetical protein